MKSPKPPSPPPVLPMPDNADPNILTENRRKAAMAASASGRASTLLSGGNSGVDKLGN